MKTGTIIAIVLAGIFLLSGIICCVVAVSMAQFDFTKLGAQEDYEEKYYEVSAAEIESITVDDKNNAITILPSPDDKIRITYYEHEKAKYEIAEKTHTLSVTYKDNRRWYEYIGFHWNLQSREIKIELPAAYQGALQAETSNGKISLSGIDFTGDVSLDTSNASIHVDDVAIAGELTADTSNGEITLEHTTAKSMNIKSSNAKIVTTHVGAADKIYLKTSNGSITLDIMEIGSVLECKTSNASVKGTVPGDMTDYTITSDTSNAKSNLPERYKGGDKTLLIDTSNGAIDVDFE